MLVEHPHPVKGVSEKDVVVSTVAIDTTTENDEAPIFADEMGQFPQLKTYNHGVALFKLDECVPRETVVESLETACAKIVEKIPWLAERVVHEKVTEGHSGLFKTAPWPAHLPPNRLLRVKDCTDLLPSYEEFSKRQMPVQMVDPDILCPVPGFPARYDESIMGPAPACLIQINFIKGGALLNFSNQHNVMDGTGVFNVVRLLSEVMNGKEIPQDAVEQGNRDRSTVTQLYPPGHPIRDHSYLHAKPLPQLSEMAPAKWAQVRFLKSAIPKVKAMAQDPEGYDTSVPFISAGDAVSALYWKIIANARVKNGHDPSVLSRYGRSIDSRTALKVPVTYMGQMVYFSSAWLTYQDLIDMPLSAIATRLRKHLNEDNTEHSIRSYVTYINRFPDKTKLMYSGPWNRAVDVSSSSMAQAALVLKFGALGVPEFIRRPNLGASPGTFYFYPPEASGDFNMLVCLNDFEMEYLKNDPLWKESTLFIG